MKNELKSYNFYFKISAENKILQNFIFISDFSGFCVSSPLTLAWHFRSKT